MISRIFSWDSLVFPCFWWKLLKLCEILLEISRFFSLNFKQKSEISRISFWDLWISSLFSKQKFGKLRIFIQDSLDFLLFFWMKRDRTPLIDRRRERVQKTFPTEKVCCLSGVFLVGFFVLLAHYYGTKKNFTLSAIYPLLFLAVSSILGAFQCQPHSPRCRTFSPLFTNFWLIPST